jgi:hypothetical protein
MQQARLPWQAVEPEERLRRKGMRRMSRSRVSPALGRAVWRRRRGWAVAAPSRVEAQMARPRPGTGTRQTQAAAVVLPLRMERLSSEGTVPWPGETQALREGLRRAVRVPDWPAWPRRTGSSGTGMVEKLEERRQQRRRARGLAVPGAAVLPLGKTEMAAVPIQLRPCVPRRSRRAVWPLEGAPCADPAGKRQFGTTRGRHGRFQTPGWPPGHCAARLR